ncbi:cystatin-C-like [Physella acuta]|uniref:cystatin-C-like n=1 Tax=Physella acuta TaxID=109671 RepID=UPI0027DD1028|nr:cystatin-C-like [Physella acuta]XP_059143280.1 cystatin-C-like [Physella acuta]
MYFFLSIIFLAVPACLAQLPGGLQEVHGLNASDPMVQFAVQAINSFYQKNGDNAARTLVNIVSAFTQVVQGELLHLNLTVTTGQQNELCVVKVWSRPWLPEPEGLKTSVDPVCTPLAQPTTKKPVLVGGERTIDLQSDEVKKALSFAVKTINNQTNSLYWKKYTGISKVTAQIVSGVSYRFYGVRLAPTDCVKSSIISDHCRVASNARSQQCDFKVWSQPWLKPAYKLTDLKCKNA